MSSTTQAPKVALLHLDVRYPMGQQIYEREITHALQEQESADCQISPISVSRLRSPLESDLKFPLRLVTEAPLSVQRALMGARLRRFDLVHRMDLRLPAAPVEVVTVHDVAPLRFPDEGSLPRRAAASLHRARAVVAPSEFAADDIANALGIERPTVIYHGVPSDAFAARSMDPSALNALGIRGRYVLQCGGASLRKNLSGLHAAWLILRERVVDVQLVLAGPSDLRRTSLFAGDDRVVMPGGVDRATLLGLMTSASVVVVPSHYEGFGFPAVEAMATGTPVVATRVSSLPEICGDAALLCDLGAEAIADALQRVMEDGQLCEQLVALGSARARSLTWHAAAEQHLGVYRLSLESA
jgi:glycosyltransferase involved in cell wall biosynthesis